MWGKDERKANKWGYEMRLRIMKLLIIGLSPAQIGPTIQVFNEEPLILPSERFIRDLRGEMRIIVETLAARAAADPAVSCCVYGIREMTLMKLCEHALGYLEADRVRWYRKGRQRLRDL